MIGAALIIVTIIFVFVLVAHMFFPDPPIYGKEIAFIQPCVYVADIRMKDGSVFQLSHTRLTDLQTGEHYYTSMNDRLTRLSGILNSGSSKFTGHEQRKLLLDTAHAITGFKHPAPSALKKSERPNDR